MIEFGITETYDPSIDYSWIDNLKVGNILITKNLTNKFIDTITQPYIQDKVILHFTVTGMGGSILEPNVPTIDQSKIQLKKLLDKGFPIKQVVLRISPIIPTDEGIGLTLSVIESFKEFNIRRIRFSTINMYDYVKDRFLENNIKYPYSTYSAPLYMRKSLIETLLNYFKIKTKEIWNKDICAEIDLDKKLLLKRACLSQKDLEILGMEDKITLIGSGKQRKSCMCPDNKKQIIRIKPQQCDYKCLYCYEPILNKDEKI